ncbi:unnamed protein product [Effrenium voratum]|nr:unnamed protein product [Effrenium voratum]
MDARPAASRPRCRGGLLQRLAELARRERYGEAPEFESEQLRRASAVFCTLSCAGRPSLRALHGVDTVLVDEAAQAVEAETLVPLCLGPKQLVLVGDPMQLSATVCHSQAAKDASYCRSMMERLMGLGQEYIMLKEQYRMHPEISRFPSKRFYGGRLIDVSTKPTEPSSLRVTLPPYAVVDVPGHEEVSRQESKVVNRREAEALARFARLVAGEPSGQHLRCASVVVITFYNGQAQLLRQLLQGHPVQVHTVDSFQGSEAEVVLLSFVRANVQRRLGFLTEFRRLNVALTRAKRSLILFANASLLRAAKAASKEDDVAALLADAAARGSIWPEHQAEQLCRSNAEPRPVKRRISKGPKSSKRAKPRPEASPRDATRRG